jgi:AcrR family transcriptional regulator
VLNNDVNEKIRTAFLSLLSEKSYSKVTFKEVASVTGMTRQNLYYYYESKENVLEDVIEEFFDRLYQTVLSVDHHSDAFPDRKTISEEIIRETAQALAEDVDIARCFLSKDVEAIFIKKNIAFMKRMLGSLVRVYDLEIRDPQYIHYLALQISGACYFPIKQWILDDMDFPVEKLVSLAAPLLEFAVPMLKKN